MTVDKLKRGNIIQDELASLKRQYNKLEKKDYVLLEELCHPCSRTIDEPFEYIEVRSKAYSRKLLKEKISILEKEFSKL